MGVIEDFLALSEVLTGEAKLDPKISEAYRARLASAYPVELDALLSAYRETAKKQDPTGTLKTALAQPQLAPIAKELVMIWYTSQFAKPDGTTDGPKSEEEYASSLLWKVIKAHVPAISKGPYGYWAKAP